MSFFFLNLPQQDKKNTTQHVKSGSLWAAGTLTRLIFRKWNWCNFLLCPHQNSSAFLPARCASPRVTLLACQAEPSPASRAQHGQGQREGRPFERGSADTWLSRTCCTAPGARAEPGIWPRSSSVRPRPLVPCCPCASRPSLPWRPLAGLPWAPPQPLPRAAGRRALGRADAGRQPGRLCAAAAASGQEVAAGEHAAPACGDAAGCASRCLERRVSAGGGGRGLFGAGEERRGPERGDKVRLSRMERSGRTKAGAQLALAEAPQDSLMQAVYKAARRCDRNSTAYTVPIRGGLE